MSLASRIAAGFFLLALQACAVPGVAPSPTGDIAISPQTEGALSAYLRKVKVTRPGVFAVSPDGLNSFYTWCGDTVCATSNYSVRALRGCLLLQLVTTAQPSRLQTGKQVCLCHRRIQRLRQKQSSNF